ncbi:MAG: hypothetical protein ACIAQF_09165 [Phycisphaerales bacterium JB065]
MNTHHNPQATVKDGLRRLARRARSRRGVVGILAMMFLVMFASLATTMAIVTQGNLRSSVSHQRVTKAMSAVDTGLQLAESRLAEAASRFIVPIGEVSPEYASALWSGNYAGFDAPPPPQPAPYGRSEPGTPTSIREAIQWHHDSDDSENLVSWDNEDNVPAPITQPANKPDWVIALPIGLERSGDGLITTAVQITYVPPSLDPDGRVLVVVTGYNWDFTRERWVTRTAYQHFSIVKRVEHAVLAPSRLMIGRNVQVNGPLGIRYDSSALGLLDGPPLYMKSDFYGLDGTLNTKLDDFKQALLDYDTDGDNRLRVNHATERVPLINLNAIDYSGNGLADSAFADVTRDGYVDDFDIFINHFDTNEDGRIALSDALRDGTPNELLSAEFTYDDAMALMIDSANPDRNGNGKYNGQFIDGAWDYSTFNDNNEDDILDAEDIDDDDITLGYRDGVLDYRDRYAKVRGSVFFRANRSDWENSTDDFGIPWGNYQQFVSGAVMPNHDDLPIVFNADDIDIPDISPDSFAAATEGLIEIAEDEASDLNAQVEMQLGAGYEPPITVEATPFAAPSPADWYERPTYTGLTFRNVTIPHGTNALFIDCTFIGVTYVETYQDNTHPSWAFYGTKKRNRFTGALEDMYPMGEDSEIALDKSWAEPGDIGYDDLPDPLIVGIDINGDGAGGDQCTDTKLVSNNIRFHNCVFVGSIVGDRATVFQNRRNKITFTGSTRFASQHPDYPDDPDYNPTESEMEQIRRSSLMLPNWSADIGLNNASPDQDVHLRGAIIAGVIDIRGNARIDGVLIADFKPVFGEAPLLLYGEPVGDPADFNITLGYFSPDDGDPEGIELGDLADLDGDGTLDLGWDSARDPETGNLIPIGSPLLDGLDPDDYPDEWFDGIVDSDAEWVPGDFARRPVPFNGFGRVIINYDPDIVLPDGLATPIRIKAHRSSYEEGRYEIPDDEEEG